MIINVIGADMKYTLLFALVFFMIHHARIARCQDEDPENRDDIEFIIERSQPLTIDLEEEEKPDQKKKKEKRKKNEFYGYKTKKGFTRTGYGDNVTVEIFYFLKEWVEPDPYVPEIYWFDFRRKRIRNTGTIDKKYGRILHGPYKKIKGDQIIEEGIFYVGTKHGRWTKYDNNDILVEKQKYYRGWPKESMVKYYDEDRKKLKEVIPVIYGEKEGDYYYFHENGEIAVKGQFKYGEKVGKWTEYYDALRRAKKQIQYKEDPYDATFIPYVLKEWNRRGELTYEK
jgi:antitoxin component YwqK of YwqJK toxin-antitoxin module